MSIRGLRKGSRRRGCIEIPGRNRVFRVFVRVPRAMNGDGVGEEGWERLAENNESPTGSLVATMRTPPRNIVVSRGLEGWRKGNCHREREEQKFSSAIFGGASSGDGWWDGRIFFHHPADLPVVKISFFSPFETTFRSTFVSSSLFYFLDIICPFEWDLRKILFTSNFDKEE